MPESNPKVGDRVRYIGVKNGTAVVGVGYNPMRWLRGGAEGTVIEIIGGYSEHDGGWIPPQMDVLVIAWDTLEGDPIERCINSEDEGNE